MGMLRVARCMPWPYLGLVELKFLPWIFSQISSSRQPSIDSQIAPEGSAEYWLQHTSPMLLCTSCGRRGCPRRIRCPGQTARSNPPSHPQTPLVSNRGTTPGCRCRCCAHEKREAPAPLGCQVGPIAASWVGDGMRGAAVPVGVRSSVGAEVEPCREQVVGDEREARDEQDQQNGDHRQVAADPTPL